MSTEALAGSSSNLSPKQIVLVAYVNMVCALFTMYTTLMHVMNRVGMATPLTCIAVSMVVAVVDVYLVFWRNLEGGNMALPGV